MSKKYTSTINITWEGNMLDAKNIEEYIVKAIKKHHKYESLDKIMNG